MKRIIEKYDHKFLKEDGCRICCTYVDVPLSELSDDCDFTGLAITIVNVKYNDCRVRITGFDKNQNGFIIQIPSFLKLFFYKAYEQGLDQCVELLRKVRYEAECIKNKKEIGYNNIVA